MRKFWDCRGFTVPSYCNRPHNWSREEICTAWGKRRCSGFILLLKLFYLMKIWKKNGMNWATLLKDNSGFQKLFLPFAHKWLFISQQQKFSSFLLCLIYSKFTGMFPVTTRLLATLPAAQNTTCLFLSCCHITTVLYVTHPLAFHSFQFLQVALESSHDLTFQLYLFFFF